MDLRTAGELLEADGDDRDADAAVTEHTSRAARSMLCHLYKRMAVKQA